MHTEPHPKAGKTVTTIAGQKYRIQDWADRLNLGVNLGPQLLYGHWDDGAGALLSTREIRTEK